MKLFLVAVLLFATTATARDYPEWPSWEEAQNWVRSNYKAETHTPKSTAIRKIEYFGEPHGFLMVAFHTNPSKPYLYQGVSRSMVNDWLAARSKGRWYHANLRGNRRYFVTLGD